MSENTAAAQHKLALPTGDTETTVSSDTSEKNTRLDTGDAVSNVGGNAVTDSGPAADPHPPSGGLKAWLYVLATFFMFISAW
jgi:hypothetical protein